MKKLMIIGASDFQKPAIEKAKQLGLKVAVVDFNPKAVGVKLADKYYNVSTIDKERILSAAKDFKADGIMTLCTDMPMRALAYVCEKLNLEGPSQETSLISTDKYLMIEEFKKQGVAHPIYFKINNKSNLKELEKKIMFPVVTKPTDNSGSRGLSLAYNMKELVEAVKYSSTNGRSGEVIVEEYMVGPEVSVEILVVDGVPNVLQITDKLTTGAPHFVEIGHSQPSRLSEKDKFKISELAKKAAIAMKIKNGPAHAEIILTKNGPKMVEIGARMGGGCITTHLVPLSTGISMTKAAIQIALGEKPDLKQKISKGSAIRFIIPPIGKIISIAGKDEAEKISGVQLVEIQCEVGQVLNKLENGTCRIGYVVAQGETAEQAIEICEKALKTICIKVESRG